MASSYFKVTLTANTTLALTGWSATVQQCIIEVVQDGTGGHTLTLPGVTYPVGSAPVVNSAANASTLLTFVSLDSGATIIGTALGDETQRAESVEATLAVLTDGIGGFGGIITVGASPTLPMGPRDVFDDTGNDPFLIGAWAASTTYLADAQVVYSGRQQQNQTGNSLGTGPVFTPLGWTPIPGNGLWTTQDQGLIAQPYDGSLAFSSTPLSAAGTINGIRVHIDESTTVSNITLQLSTAASVLTTGQCFAALYSYNFTSGSVTLLSKTPDASGATYTVSTTTSSASVSGTGFVASALVGGQFTIAGVAGTYKVLSVQSSTHLTMTTTIPTGVTGQTMTPVVTWETTGTKTMPLVTPQSVTPGDFAIVFWANGTTMPGPTRANASAQVNFGLSAANSRYFTADTGVTTTAPSVLGTSSAVAALNVSYWAALT